MPWPWFCSSPLVIIHVGSDPSWDQTGQLLLRDFWLGNRNRAQNRRKRMKGFRIRLRTITFVLAVAMPHTNQHLGAAFWPHHLKRSWSSIQAVYQSIRSTCKSKRGSGANHRACCWPHWAVYHFFYLLLLWTDQEPDDKSLQCMI